MKIQTDSHFGFEEYLGACDRGSPAAIEDTRSGSSALSAVSNAKGACPAIRFELSKTSFVTHYTNVDSKCEVE